MDATPLNADARTDFGKGAARKLRAAGKIPALVYRGGDTPTHITVDPQELRLIFQRSQNPNTILTIDIDGTQRNCLLTATQKHPVSRHLLHADFYEVIAGQEVTVEVPVFPQGKAKGAVVGGKIQYIRRSVPVACLPKDIPARIDIDVTEVDLNDFVRASAVELPAGCRLASDNDFNVLACKGRKVEAEESELDEDGEETEGEGEGEGDAE